MLKKAPTTIRFHDLKFEPRFEYGDVCTIGVTVGDSYGSELGTGFARMRRAHIPWTVKYDEVLTVIEGHLRVHIGGEVHELGRLDSLWIPNGTSLIYEAEDALVHYAIYPAKF
jgi:ethanolamine utilization protein EutQ